MITMIENLIKEHMDRTPVMIFVVPKAAEKENMYDERI